MYLDQEIEPALLVLDVVFVVLTAVFVATGAAMFIAYGSMAGFALALVAGNLFARWA